MATNDIYDGAYPEPSGTIPATYRYFRLTFNGAWFNNIAQVSQIEAIASAARVTATTVTSSADLSGYPVANIADLNYTSLWYADVGTWAKLDFATPTAIDGFVISLPAAINTLATNKIAPKKITLEASNDDATWVQLSKIQINCMPHRYFFFYVDGSVYEDSVSLTADATGGAGYKYYKMQVLRRADTRAATPPSYVRIHELKFYTSDGILFPLEVDSYESAYDTVASCVDESDSTYWEIHDNVYSITLTLPTDCYGIYPAAGLFGFGKRVELVGISMTVDAAANDTQPVAWKLYGTNDGTTYDLLQYVNDYEWAGDGTYDTAYFPIDVASTGAVYSASGFVIRNGSPAQADVHFYNATTNELIYSTASSAVDGSWTYRSGTNAPIYVVCEGAESEGYQVQGIIQPT